MPVDFIIGAAVGAAVGSQSIRQAIRKGLVYSVGGTLVAFDTVTTLGRRKGVPASATNANGTAILPAKADATTASSAPVAAPSPSVTPS